MKKAEKNPNVGANIFPIFIRCKDYFKIFSMCFYKINSNKFNYKKSYVEICNKKFHIKYLFGKGIKFFKFKEYHFYFNLYILNINYDDLTDMEIHNKINYHFVTNEKDIEAGFLYNLIYLTFGIGAHSRIHNYDNMDLCAYIRQNAKNTIGVTIRNKNYTDNDYMKIFFAWILSLFSFRSKIIILYEKNNEKYEESASVVYEKLIDKKYPAYFILNKNSKHWVNIEEKYRKNVIESFSFKHYYYYFKCKKFIATESFPHAMELRTTNRLINLKIFLKKYKYVFLQHGVMYMVSLDSGFRSAFSKGITMPTDSKIVVSSKLEAQHFIDLGGFTKEDLYISGLPAYDKSIKNTDADKITIMPTWRPWDFNVLESNYKESSYYKMIKNIINNIPEKYKDKIVLLPHPLIKDKFHNMEISKYISNEISYDKALEKTKLLITDYSSIAYSSFYRGSNVIFCWMEKDECMQHYEAHLMLNEKNVYGDICYNYKDLSKLIEKNYACKQNPKYLKNYRKIVEFHDNNNTQRLFNFLVKDKFFD